MFNRSFISVLVVTSAFTLAFGQTPEAKKQKMEAPQALAFTLDGEGGYLGIQMQDVTKENFAKYGLRDVRGVAVEKVSENSPAAAAGLQNGDVIVRFNGDEVTSARKLTRLVGEVAPDHQVKLTVLRGGSEKELTATLGKRPSPEFGNGNFTFSTPGPMGNFDIEKLKDLPQLKDFPELKDMPNGEGFKTFTLPNGGEGKVFTWSSGSSRQIGVGVYPMTKQLGEQYGVDGGVMINEVRENSPASRAGLKAGDIIVEINGKAVKSDLDLIRELGAKKDGDVTLTFVRDRKRQSVSVTPEAGKGNGFMFKTDGDDGLNLTPTPGQFRLAQPITPMAAPIPMNFIMPGRII
jgi:serine protease Do